jgi:hypothetical protein
MSGVDERKDLDIDYERFRQIYKTFQAAHSTSLHLLGSATDPMKEIEKYRWY